LYHNGAIWKFQVYVASTTDDGARGASYGYSHPSGNVLPPSSPSALKLFLFPFLYPPSHPHTPSSPATCYLLVEVVLVVVQGEVMVVLLCVSHHIITTVKAEQCRRVTGGDIVQMIETWAVSEDLFREKM